MDDKNKKFLLKYTEYTGYFNIINVEGSKNL